jgi:hypothetical protein
MKTNDQILRDSLQRLHAAVSRRHGRADPAELETREELQRLDARENEMRADATLDNRLVDVVGDLVVGR